MNKIKAIDVIEDLYKKYPEITFFQTGLITGLVKQDRHGLIRNKYIQCSKLSNEQIEYLKSKYNNIEIVTENLQFHSNLIILNVEVL